MPSRERWAVGLPARAGHSRHRGDRAGSGRRGLPGSVSSSFCSVMSSCFYLKLICQNSYIFLYDLEFFLWEIVIIFELSYLKIYKVFALVLFFFF